MSCKCEGLYLPSNYFDSETEREERIEIIKLMNKNILFNFKYQKYRPPFRASEDKKIQKRYTEKIEFIRKLTDIENAKRWVQEIYQNHQKSYNNLKDKEIDDLLAELAEQGIPNVPNVDNFEFPFLVFPPENIKDYTELVGLFSKVNDNLFEIQNSDTQYNDCIYTICLSKEDLRDSSERMMNEVEKANSFSFIAIWIVNFNELYVTAEEIQAFYRFLNMIENGKTRIYLRFVGNLVERLCRFLGPKYYCILRLNGYPGNNINSIYGLHTRRFVDPRSFDFLNQKSIKDKIGDSYHCNCDVCTGFEINSYQKAEDLFLQEEGLSSSPYYRNYIGKAHDAKYIEEKLRRIQNTHSLKHGFFQQNSIASKTFDEFRSVYTQINNFRFWNEIFEDARVKEVVPWEKI